MKCRSSQRYSTASSRQYSAPRLDEFDDMDLEFDFAAKDSDTEDEFDALQDDPKESQDSETFATSAVDGEYLSNNF